MKVYIETYGCQMNEADSEVVARILAEEGIGAASSAEEADAVLVNTCAVRAGAENRVLQRVEDLKAIRARRPGFLVGVLGCVAQIRKDALLRPPWDADLAAGPDAYRSIPRLLAEARGGRRVRETRLLRVDDYDRIDPVRRPGANAWVTVTRGCDNFCAYCVVPFARGRERSRSPESILREVRRAAAEGFRQVTLLGQNVNSYRSGDADFAAVLRAACRVPGILRVRFTSPHPKDFPDELLAAIAGEPAASPHVHLPLQSGSDPVLERMGRGYGRRDYLALVGRIRAAVPEAALTTDVIAGFPGEREEDFQATLDVMEEVRFHSAFTFAYSVRRPSIAARRYADDVPEPVKRERVERLVEVERRISRERLEEEVGNRVEVLVERRSRKSARDAFGRTPGGSGVVFPAPEAAPGDLVRVLVERATTHTLIGKIAPADG
ncbi:MAG: tRNA (N6-isopentenyl adenosine(37)-C2)-methylthiotransferase MiaB [Candidatus Eisenbacteria bacterium]|nr:tRNA (N6-isopentenyl adenosine(37)-C2)-methylthiotransferase MiaB [Candidatus Eisenbacteria bacterium]